MMTPDSLIFSVKFLLTFRNLLLVSFLLVLSGSGYLGYLSALVDIDQSVFIEQVRAVTDKSRLESQLLRAKSILNARSRAYLRRSLEFIQQKRQELTVDFSTPAQEIASIDEFLTVYEDDPSQLTDAEQRSLLALQEERKDLGFFEDEVKTINTLLVRELDDKEIPLVLAGKRSRRTITGALRRLLQLLDKRKELSIKREKARKDYNYWEKYPKGAPEDIEITIHNKSSVTKELNPVHITQISTALSIMPQGFDHRLRKIYVVYGDTKMRRGMSGLGVVFLRGEDLDFFRVLIHEFGHIYDLYREVNIGELSEFYDGNFRLYKNDPSVDFYSFSWKNGRERNSNKDSFVSVYGSSDPFEDFAESYALYVLQGETFRTWRKDNDVIAEKYDFIRDAFDFKDFPASKVFRIRPYDVTMLLVDYNVLLQ